MEKYKAKFPLFIVSAALILTLVLALTNYNAKNKALEISERLNQQVLSMQESNAELEEALTNANAELEDLKAEADPLPKLYFTGDITEMNSKSDVRKIAVHYDDENHPFSGYAELTIQGTSSLGYAKKNFTIKLFEDENCENRMPIDVGWGEQYKYCLKANWIDKTHARNIVTARLAAQAQKDNAFFSNAPNAGLIDGFPIEIYVNGAFHGIYTFNIPKDGWMFGMDEENPDHIVFCSEDWLPGNRFAELPDYTTWSIEVGNEDEATLAKLTALFEFIISSSDSEFSQNLQQHIDLDSALNYIVFMDFAFLLDNRAKNMLLVTYDGTVWAPSLYDLDCSWGSHYSGGSIWDYDAKYFVDNRLIERIRELFPKELHKRYFELRKEILSKENIMSEFTSFIRSIPKASFLREQKKWGVIPGFDLYQIEDYIDTMSSRIDEKYAALIH